MKSADLPNHLRVNSPHVIAESVDGEVLIIHLLTGSYYSTTDAGEAIWQLVSDGTPTPMIPLRLAARFDADIADIDDATAGWLSQLIEEDLLVEGVNEEPVTATAAAAVDGAERTPFVAPALHKYTDMQDLLLLDPVHEVAAEGWPVAQRQ